MSIPTPATLIAVAKNAARHLIEANQHHSGQRYASAVTSAIFAIEEAGKLSILTIGGKLPKSNKRHATHAILYYAFLRLAEDWQWTMEWQPILRNGWTPCVVLTERQQTMMTEHPEFAEFVRRLQAGELSTVEERTQALVAATVAKNDRDGTNERWKPITEQGLNQRRIRATYVDVTEMGFTSPETTSSDEASAICWVAYGLLLLTLMIAVHVGPLEDYKLEVAKMLPDDVELIGSTDIAQFIERFTKAAAARQQAEAG